MPSSIPVTSYPADTLVTYSVIRFVRSMVVRVFVSVVPVESASIVVLIYHLDSSSFLVTALYCVSVPLDSLKNHGFALVAFLLSIITRCDNFPGSFE